MAPPVGNQRIGSGNGEVLRGVEKKRNREEEERSGTPTPRGSGTGRGRGRGRLSAPVNTRENRSKLRGDEASTQRTLRSPFADGDLPTGNVDPEYLFFLQHIRIDGDSYTLDIPAQGDSPPCVIKYEAPLAIPSNGECISDPSLGRRSSNLSTEERDSSASLDVEPARYDSLDDVDEDYRPFLKHSCVVDGQLVLKIEDTVVNYDQPDVARSQGEKDNPRAKEAAIASPGKGLNVRAGREEVSSGAATTVVQEQYDWRADPSPQHEVNIGGDGGLSDAGMLKGVHSEVGSSDGRHVGCLTIPGEAVEKELGIIWPTHITRRPDSDFKERLIEALTKPATPKEYFILFDKLSIRTPLMKQRQVRNETKLYATEEMGRSYLDHYPDLTEQIMNSDRRNGLALMRGLLFWLQNNPHEDSFKPWVDDSNDQGVIHVD